MLDTTIVNIIRRRILSEDQRRASEKWQRAIRTVEWIIANVPKDSNLQLFTFNNEAKSLISGSGSSWIRAVDREDIDLAIEALKEVVPQGGTSLLHPFLMAREMKPVPDSIWLIVDSLPTMAFEPSGASNIESRDRMRVFDDALNELPLNTPVNVILFPMEGDPFASPRFWRLAQLTGGSFLSPSKDWP